MTIASLVISALAVIVSGCSAYWTLRLRKAQRELAAMPQPIVEFKRTLTPGEERTLTPGEERKLRADFDAAMRHHRRTP